MTSKRFVHRATLGVQGLHPYIPGKPVEELERELGILDSIKLASNENPLGPSPLGWAAAQQAAGDLNLYPDDTGHRLRNRLSGEHGVDPAQIVLGAGSSDVLDMVARTFLGPGVNAVFADHSFAMYSIYTQASGAESRVAPALPADHPTQPFGHDPGALLAAIDSNTRVVFIANPNNPTGTWLSRTELEGFLAQVPPEVVVVLDEAYTQYVGDPSFPDGMQWLAQHPNLLVTRTFSKIYGLAGLRIGYGVGNPELVSLVGRVRHPFNVNTIALAAAEAALDDGDFVRRSAEVNAAGRRELGRGLHGLGLRFIPSVANFLCVEFGLPGIDMYEALLREGVIVRPVANYGLPNHLRITVGTENENRVLLDALARVLGR